MFESDNPIIHNKNDQLSRSHFSTEIANAILSYNSDDNFTISLCGPWGSGKTSVLNMIKESIELSAHQFSKDEQPFIINFNPWNYSNSEQLLSQFFKTIKDELNCSNNKNLKKIGNALENYYNIIEFTSFIPVVGKYFKPLSKIFKGLGNQISEITSQKESISNQKSEIIKLLKEQKHKFIIVIDDIDRLSNEEICLIFKLVNSIADFPNLIYLLSFDKEVVTRALHDIQKCDGLEYLEKIIQVPFDIPIPKKSQIEDVFFNKLDKIIDEPVDDKEYWSDVFNKCISPFLSNIRDVIRILNVFKFKYDLLHKELYWIDLLAITVLQIFEPQIYNWIYENKIFITGSAENRNFVLLNNATQQEQENSITNEVKKLVKTDETKVAESLQTIFPSFSVHTISYAYDYSSNDELRGKHRIASPDKFDLFFYMSLSDIKISSDEIMNSINNMSQKELNVYLNQLSKKALIKEYLHELSGKISHIKSNKITIFLEELFKIQSCDKNKEVDNELVISVSDDAMYCIRRLYTQINNGDRIDYLIELIQNCDYNVFPTIFEFIYYLEKYSGEFNGDISSELKLIDEDMSKIERQLVLKLKHLPSTINILDTDNYWAFYCLWRKIDANAYDNYISLKLKENENIPKFLDIYKGVWSSGKYEGITFKDDSYDNYISKEDLYSKIIELKGTDKFKLLKHKFKQNAVGFYQYYNSSENDFHDKTNTELINSIIKDWESD